MYFLSVSLQMRHTYCINDAGLEKDKANSRCECDRTSAEGSRGGWTWMGAALFICKSLVLFRKHNHRVVDDDLSNEKYDRCCS